jgi:protein tyrosine phosphatase domain-containing protein 1
MSVPSSMNYMLDIVKEMSIVTIDKKGKVIVHCHAGYGRTGIVIVCYLLFISLKDSDTIIQEVRSKRKKCVETKDQIKYCKKFEEFLKHSRILFGNKENIDVYLKRQEDLLFGNELNKYGFVPKLIVKVLEKVCLLKKNII